MKFRPLHDRVVIRRIEGEEKTVPIRLMQTPTICSVIQTNYGFTEL
jgi:co-chaperonin GroES (HSP10)